MPHAYQVALQTHAGIFRIIMCWYVRRRRTSGVNLAPDYLFDGGAILCRGTRLVICAAVTHITMAAADHSQDVNSCAVPSPASERGLRALFERQHGCAFQLYACCNDAVRVNRSPPRLGMSNFTAGTPGT